MKRMSAFSASLPGTGLAENHPKRPSRAGWHGSHRNRPDRLHQLRPSDGLSPHDRAGVRSYPLTAGPAKCFKWLCSGKFVQRGPQHLVSPNLAKCPPFLCELRYISPYGGTPGSCSGSTTIRRSGSSPARPSRATPPRRHQEDQPGPGRTSRRPAGPDGEGSTPDRMPDRHALLMLALESIGPQGGLLIEASSSL